MPSLQLGCYLLPLSHTHMHTGISTLSTMSCSQSTQTDMRAASNQQSGTMSLRVSTVEELNSSRKWARRVTDCWCVYIVRPFISLYLVLKDKSCDIVKACYILFLSAIKLHHCSKTIKKTSISHTIVQGDMFLHYHEHAQCSLFWLNPTHSPAAVILRSKV